MLTDYIQAAMHKAHYEILPDGEGYFGRIPDLQGVWANAETLEACRKELQEILEEWIMLGLKMGTPIPIIDGIELNIEQELIKKNGKNFNHALRYKNPHSRRGYLRRPRIMVS